MKKKLKTIVLSLIILLCTHINAQSKKKLDREAIKEMCGCFEIEFKYSETFSPKGDYVESKDYKTKALEWATLILDEKNELSIQHLLIINDSMVIKHWRQDWEYESEKTRSIIDQALVLTLKNLKKSIFLKLDNYFKLTKNNIINKYLEKIAICAPIPCRLFNSLSFIILSIILFLTEKSKE